MISFDKFNGMDNQHRAESIPGPSRERPGWFLRNAVNVQFDAQGKAKRVKGATEIYAGTGIHSLWGFYFVESGYLKRLNADNTATTLGLVGDEPIGYTSAGGRLFCGNGSGFEVVGDTLKPVGITWPEQQPILQPLTIGALFPGSYQVAITYMRDGEQSGCGVASTIDLPDGGGIYFDLPTIPADIDRVAIWCSSVNGDILYLYDEVLATATSVFITEKPTAYEIKNQFSYPPKFSNVLCHHYGRIYWADGNALRWTEAIKYGYTKAGNNALFGGDVTLIVSLPGVLYVCADKTYRITNIDQEGFSQRVEVLPYGAAKNAAVYDDNYKRAFWISHRGIVEATSEGVKETVFDTLAMPKYDEAALGLAKMDGEFQLVVVAQGGEVSALMDDELKASEIARKGNAL